MSRYAKKIDEEKTLVYGWDHVLGFFYDIWENMDTKEEKVLKYRCSKFGMPKSELVEVLTENKVNKKHLMKLALDTPF
jgi:hypothetical protein